MPILLLFVALGLASCASCEFPLGRPGVTLVAYNAMTVFDARDDGTEYPGFSVRKGQWGADAVRERIAGIREAVTLAARGGADVIVLSEIENEGLLDAIADSFGPGAYPGRYMAREEGAVFACGILSRLPASDVRSHQAVLPSGARSRQMLEVCLESPAGRIRVLACHWKSKVEGAMATEPDRIAAASLAGSRVREILAEDPLCSVVIAGDLNESADEEGRVAGLYDVALSRSENGPGLVVGNLAGGGGQKPEVLHSPWLEPGMEGRGSYVHKGQWETIDHFLLDLSLFDGKGLEYASFSVAIDPALLDPEGRPAGWQTKSRSGHSDHLPIVLHLADSGGGK